jgi:benzoylformate decarboxylase
MDAGNPLYQGQLGHMFGEDSRSRIGAADAVLIVGTYLFPEVFPLLDSPFRPGARLVHIDLDVYEIAKNFPVDVALAADPKCTLAALADLLGGADDSRLGGVAPAAEPVKEPAKDMSLAGQFAAELARQAPANLVVFDEALTASPALWSHLLARTPGSVHATRGGSLGVGIPGAIGAKLARPDAEVVGFTGDGGAMYTFQALWTAARHDVAARFVVCDNRRYRLLDRNIDHYWAERAIPRHASPGAFDLSRPEIDFTGLARALGVPAVRVDKPDQVEAAVAAMLGCAGPFLVDLDTA